MGWMLKAGALLLGLFCLNVFLWPVSILCFGYLGYSLWSGTRARRIYVRDAAGGAQQAPQAAKPGLFKRRYIAAALLFVLGFLALAARGTYSPVVFFGLGGAIAASGVIRVFPSSLALDPVPSSILLRSRLFPLRWVSLVEVKFGTGQMARALSSVGSEVMIAASAEKTSVYLPIRVLALSLNQADRKVCEALAPLARALSARGAYVLPLDSSEGAARLDWRLRPVGIALEYHRDGVVSLKSTPFDVLVLNPEGHLVRSAATYARQPDKKGQPAVLPSSGKKLGSRPMLWDALEALQERFSLAPADPMTTFLSGVCATQGEPLGDRLVNRGEGDAGTVAVSSIGAGQVQLTRPQLRAIVSAYA